MSATPLTDKLMLELLAPGVELSPEAKIRIMYVVKRLGIMEHQVSRGLTYKSGYGTIEIPTRGKNDGPVQRDNRGDIENGSESDLPGVPSDAAP